MNTKIASCILIYWKFLRMTLLKAWILGLEETVQSLRTLAKGDAPSTVGMGEDGP